MGGKSNIGHYFAIFKYLDIFNSTVVKLIVLYIKHVISNLKSSGNYFPCETELELYFIKSAQNQITATKGIYLFISHK